MKMKGWLIRRGLLAVLVLLMGLVLVWRNSPKKVVETAGCTRELDEFYRQIIDYAEANDGKLPETIVCPGFVYLGPEFDWKQVTPLVVELPERHDVVDGKGTVCLLLNNGKTVIFRTTAADTAALAAELGRLYPHDQLHWMETLAGK